MRVKEPKIARSGLQVLLPAFNPKGIAKARIQARCYKAAEQIVSPYRVLFFEHNIKGYNLCYKNINVSFTFIPKNGCRNMRTTLCMANGTMREDLDIVMSEEDYRLIGESFDAHATTKKCIVLRNPLSRAVSAYLDKIIKEDLEIYAREACEAIFHYCGFSDEDMRCLIKRGKRPTFEQFIEYLVRTPDYELDSHWRSQCSFFTFMKYDRIFALEKLDCDWTASDFGHIPLTDPPVSHRSSANKKIASSNSELGIPGNISALSGEILRNVMSEKGLTPSTEMFFNSPEIRNIYSTRFADDLNVFEYLFPSIIRESSGIKLPLPSNGRILFTLQKMLY